MTYRDDAEALRARVTALETELAAAHETIAHLRGERVAAEPVAPRREWLAGAPTSLVLTRDLDVEPTAEAFTATAELMRARLARAGHVSQVAQTLSYRHGTLDVTVGPAEEGRTRVSLRVNLSHLGMISVFASVCAMLVSVPPVGAAFGPAALAVSLPIVGIVTFLLGRALTARMVRAERARLAGVFEAITALVGCHGAARARVAVDGDAVAPEAEQAPEDEAGLASTRGASTR